MSRYYSNEISVIEILNKVKVERGDLNDLRELWRDVDELKRRIEESGKLKIGNNKFKNLDSENIEKLLLNILLRWRVIRMGI